jgi:hypothetical protein
MFQGRSKQLRPFCFAAFLALQQGWLAGRATSAGNAADSITLICCPGKLCLLRPIAHRFDPQKSPEVH